MSDTQRGGKAPTTDGNDTEQLTDGGENSGPDWESIARTKLSTQMTADFEQNILPLVHKVSLSIDNGEDPTGDLWKMISRFGEFCTRVREDVSTVGESSFREPKSRLHSDARYIEDQLLNLGNAIENDNYRDSPRGDEFERARRALKHAEATVDELEEEYRGISEEEHKEQVTGIARRHPLEDDDE